MNSMPFGRRALLKGLGVTAGLTATGYAVPSLAAAVANIGGDEIGRVDDDEKGSSLNFLCWEGYDDPSVGDPFARQYDGARIRYQLVNSDPDAVNKLRGGQDKVFDLVNLNNPWANVMYDEDLILPLDEGTFRDYYDRMIDRFSWPYKWAHSNKDGRLLGMVQRFGPMSFVVNTEKISKAAARSEGYDIALEKSMQGRYGILGWPNETQYVFSIMGGANPYVSKSPEQLEKISEITRYVLKHARMVDENPGALNNALLNGEIDMYMAGGTYTVSALRYDGFPQFLSVSPDSGPIVGRGGIAYVEITSVINNPELSPLAGDYLHYMQTPEAALNIARVGGTLNPVATIHEIKDQLTKDELVAMQYDDLEEHMALCAEFEVNPDYEVMTKVWAEALRERG